MPFQSHERKERKKSRKNKVTVSTFNLTPCWFEE